MKDAAYSQHITSCTQVNVPGQVTGVVHQGILLSQLRHIFPGSKTYENARKESAFLYPTRGYMEFDIWLPDLKLCFEFQDVYHYVTTWYNHIPLPEITHKDDFKKSVARQNDIDLVSVPCWWDTSLESISATIHFYRPDLLERPIHGRPTPLTPPPDFFQGQEMPGVGELMSASFPLEKFTLEEHGEWWMGEKYDGIRCCWNSDQKKVYSRTGKGLFVLPSLIRHLPNILLDGEFWFGRGQYTATRAVIHHSDFVRWQRLRMISFDVPSYDVQRNPFEARYRLLLQNCPHENPFNIVAFRILSTAKSDLKIAIKGIINHGGEGVILRKVGSLYEQGRSPNLLKLKDAEVDQEAIVVGKEHESIQLQLPNGTTFFVPPEDNLVAALKIGDIVTVTHELRAAQALPMRPKILRVRTDLSWKEVVLNAQRDGVHLTQQGFTKQPIGFWTRGNMRAFMEDFAKSKKKDPLRPNTWYSITADSVRQTKGGRAVLEKFKGGYAHALRYLFPELKFDNSAFQRSSWHKTENRRAFFEEYARRNKFDPQNANNWYSESKRLMFVRGALGVIQYHNNSMAKALIDLFPNIGLEEKKFQSKSLYHKAETRRDFFEKYAKAQGFDPLLPDNWYTQPSEKILSTEGAFEVILHHGRSVSRSLRELFSEIGLEKTKFWLNGKWKDKNKRRDFFAEYAEEKGFDPRSPKNWYSVSYEDFMSRKGAKIVLSFHKNSIAQALTDLFPDVLFDGRYLPFTDRWEDPVTRKRFFENFARKNGFNPSDPRSWSQETTRSLLSTKGVNQVLQYHNNSLRKALRDLFPDSKVQASWGEKSNRRKFFEDYAKANGFDPLVPDNWYSHSSENILSVKGAFSVIQHHGNSVSTALLDLFPDIGLDKLEFKAKYLWNDVENRKRFFYAYAKENNFDCKNATSWYEQPYDWVMSKKGAKGVMSHYDESVPKALMELFPDIGLSVERFQQQNFWHNDSNYRRKFFEIYARNNGFDPLIPENWYQQSVERIMSVKGVLKVVLHHKRSVARALVDLFPEIGLIHSKLW